MVFSLLLLFLFLLLRRRLLLALLLYKFSLGVAIVTGEEANSGNSRNALVTGLRNDSDSITPTSVCLIYPYRSCNYDRYDSSDKE